MFSFSRKKSLVKRAVFTGAVLVFLTGFLFVSCSDGGGGNHNNAQTPIISVQPQSDIWDVDIEDEFKLTVTASVTDGGTLSYQWYKNAAKSKSGGTVIHQEISETLTLNSEDYTENGDYYFYVVVTNTKAGGKASVTSNAATVTVDGVGGVYRNAQKPIIETQPADTFWNVYTAASGVKLTVEAHVTDGGALSYQWYSNTSNSVVNGTKIDTVTGKDYALTKTAYTANGTYYFYVIITNTNNDVTGLKNVSVTSHVAAVTVVGYPDTAYSDTHTMPSKLIGEWESEWGELYTISAGEFSSGADWGDGWSGYKGTIVNHRGNSAGTAGYITIKYTQNDWDETAENKYYVIYYKDLTETTVTIAGAGSFVFTDPDFGASGGRSTEDEAEATYTVSAGYFAMGSDLTRAEGFVLDPNYVGFWSASNGGYDGFVISASPPSIYNTFNTSDIDDPDSIFYKGTIHDIVYFNSNTEGIMYVEFTQKSEWFASSGSGNFTAIYLRIVNETSMGIFLIANADNGGADTPMYANLEAAKTAVNSSNVLTFIYGSVTDDLTYDKQ